MDWALKLQDPDHALGVCKALLKMCERIIPNRKAEVLCCLGQCYFTLVSSNRLYHMIIQNFDMNLLFRKALMMPKMPIIKLKACVKMTVLNLRL